MVYKSLCILGRQPAIGRAELESVVGGAHLSVISDEVVALDTAPADIPFARLGGSIRLAEVVTVVPSVQWPVVARAMADTLAQLLASLPEGKVKLGLSCFGMPISPRHLLRAGLELKKVCKQHGRSVRVIPNTETALSSAQVLHNQLTSAVGIEFLLVKHGNTTVLARTTNVQDITAYAQRDQGRPKRDARVGMLPPKLAQIITNLGVGTAVPSKDFTVLDPFCGTGVVLQEALLMGFSAYGTDLEPRMTDYSQSNIDWLREKHDLPGELHLETGDATSLHWQHSISAVACETYLGRPLSSWPNTDTLHEIMGTCNVIIEKFLRNIGEQLQPGTRLCLGLPAWRSPEGRTYHLQLLDHLRDLGYNRISFEHARDDELVYFRPDQLVARELLVITRN